MTREDFLPIYRRLCHAYNKPSDPTDEDVIEHLRVYFDGLSDFPATCVQQAAQRHMRTEKFFPKLSELVTGAREERQRLNAPAYRMDEACQDCHGDLWVPGEPRHEFGHIYETVTRCPRCRPARTA